MKIGFIRRKNCIDDDFSKVYSVTVGGFFGVMKFPGIIRYNHTIRAGHSCVKCYLLTRTATARLANYYILRILVWTRVCHKSLHRWWVIVTREKFLIACYTSKIIATPVLKESTREYHTVFFSNWNTSTANTSYDDESQYYLRSFVCCFVSAVTSYIPNQNELSEKIKSYNFSENPNTRRDRSTRSQAEYGRLYSVFR